MPTSLVLFPSHFRNEVSRWFLFFIQLLSVAFVETIGSIPKRLASGGDR